MQSSVIAADHAAGGRRYTTQGITSWSEDRGSENRTSVIERLLRKVTRIRRARRSSRVKSRRASDCVSASLYTGQILLRWLGTESQCRRSMHRHGNQSLRSSLRHWGPWVIFDYA